METCVQRAGDLECPSGSTVKHTFFEGAADSRACAPCACGAPEGGSCTAIALAYSDDGCVVAVGAETVQAGAAGEGFDVPAGSALGSKAAEVIAKPGSCAPSGGGATGTVEASGRVTVCCLPGKDERTR